MLIPSLVYCSTDRCDMKCGYCPTEGPNSYGENFEVSIAPLPAEDVVWVANVIGKMGFETFRLTGGEPLLQPKRVAAILTGIVDGDHFGNVRLNTNGSRLSQAVSLLKEINLTAIKVSLDTLDEELFQKITKSPKFQAVVRGIEDANKAGLPIEVNAVLTSETASGMMDLAEWCQDRSIPLKILDLVSYDSQEDGYIEQQKVETRNLNRLLLARFGRPTIVQLGGKRGIYMKQYGNSPYVLFKDCAEGTTFTNFCHGCPHYPCEEGIHHLSLSTDGHLRPCRIRNNVYWDLRSIISSRDASGLKRLTTFILEQFYSGEFSLTPQETALSI